MGMTLSECEMILPELTAALTGGWIQKIHQPRPFLLTIDVRVPGATHRLLICVDPKFARVHLTTVKFDNPPSPLPFCLFLRSHVDGGRLTAIRQEPGDRVFYLAVEKGERAYTVVAALTGNRSNVLVLNDRHEIMRTLRETGESIGTRYTPPRPSSGHPQPAPAPVHTAPSSLVTAAPAETEPSSPSGSRDATFAGRFPLSYALAQRYHDAEATHTATAVLQQHTAHTRKALKQAKKKLHALEEDVTKVERYREYGRYGELLKAQLGSLQKGQAQVTVVDYYDPSLPELTLPLDPTKDPVWNMKDYFKKFHKFQAAQEHLLPRVEAARQTVKVLEFQLAELEQGQLPSDERLQSLPPKRSSSSSRQLSPPAQTGSPPTKRPGAAQGYRTFTSLDGIPILVGKTAKDNDDLTFKVGKPDDVWLHARGTPGSHVIIRLEKGATVRPETLKDAAMLTLWFSDLRKSGKGEVIYTLRKFVKKGKGFKPGSVTVTREKSIWVELKDDRLARLKGQPT